MTAQPLFWLYVFFQFQIFIYLTNRLAFRPRFRVLETTWTLTWIAFTLGVQTALTLVLAYCWNFSAADWQGIPFFWKAFTALLALSVLGYWAEFLFWFLFIKKPVASRLLSRRLLKLEGRRCSP